MNTGRQVEFHQSVYGLRSGLNYVEKPVVRPPLKLLTRLLVNVRPTEDRPTIYGRWQRKGTSNVDPCPPSCLDNLLGGLVEQLVIIRLQTNPNLVPAAI